MVSALRELTKVSVSSRPAVKPVGGWGEFRIKDCHKFMENTLKGTSKNNFFWGGGGGGCMAEVHFYP